MRYSSNHWGTRCANLIDCIKKTYGRMGELGIRICTIAETWFSWKRKSLDGWSNFCQLGLARGRTWLSNWKRQSTRVLRDRGRKSRRGRQRYKGTVQDYGVLAFKLWGRFPGMMIELLSSVDWRCGTELDFADVGPFSCGN